MKIARLSSDQIAYIFSLSYSLSGYRRLRRARVEAKSVIAHG